jgi:hypothetical protein
MTGDFAPERIGAVHFTFAYEAPAIAKVAWERAERRVRFIAMFRHTLDGDLSRQAITVLAEDDEQCRPQVAKARRLLVPGVEIETPGDVLDVLRLKRLQTLMEVGLQGGGKVRRRVRFGEQGAVLDPLGGVHLRRRQG